MSKIEPIDTENEEYHIEVDGEIMHSELQYLSISTARKVNEIIEELNKREK